MGKQLDVSCTRHARASLRALGCTTVANEKVRFVATPLRAQASIGGTLVASMMRRADQHCMATVRVTQQLLMLATVELEREEGKGGGHKASLMCRAGEQQVRGNRSTRLCCV